MMKTNFLEIFKGKNCPEVKFQMRTSTVFQIHVAQFDRV